MMEDPPIQIRLHAQKLATEYMYELAQNRQLPHALEDYHVVARRNNAHPPGEGVYLPLEAVMLPENEPLPPIFIKAGITREQSESLISRQLEKDKKLWESEFSSDKPFNPEPQLFTSLDGKNYPVIFLEKEAGANRKSIIGARLKPLGYKVKKKAGGYCYVKELSERESLTCNFDFGTWRGTLNSSFTYSRIYEISHRFNVTVPFVYWTVGRRDNAGVIGVKDVPLTTERNLHLVFDNIAKLAQKLEENIVPGWRQSAAAVQTIG